MKHVPFQQSTYLCLIVREQYNKCKYLPKKWTEIRENQCGIYSKPILLIGIEHRDKDFFLNKLRWFDPQKSA